MHWNAGCPDRLHIVGKCGGTSRVVCNPVVSLAVMGAPGNVDEVARIGWWMW